MQWNSEYCPNVLKKSELALKAVFVVSARDHNSAAQAGYSHGHIEFENSHLRLTLARGGGDATPPDIFFETSGKMVARSIPIFQCFMDIF